MLGCHALAASRLGSWAVGLHRLGDGSGCRYPKHVAAVWRVSRFTGRVERRVPQTLWPNPTPLNPA